MGSVIKVRVKNLFPYPFIITGLVIILLGLVLFNFHPFTSIFIFLMGLCIVFARDGLEIDKDHKIIREFSSLFGIKNYKKITYNRLDEIVIKEKILNPTLEREYGGVFSFLTYPSFSAFLILGNGEEVWLRSDRSIEKLKIKIRPLAELLELDFREEKE